LKGKKLRGYDFHRQKPIDNFIVDLFCNELSLAIEIDGSTHNDKVKQDDARQARLESLGVHVVRFTEMQVRQGLQDVLMAIEEWIDAHEPIVQADLEKEESSQPSSPIERGL